MLKAVVFTVLLVLVAAMASITLAQDAVDTCSTSDWQEKISTVSSSLSQLSAGVVDEASALQVLSIAQEAIHTVRTSCVGFTFTSADYPTGIIGPVGFDGTLYQITFTSTGGLSMINDVGSEGDCGFAGIFMSTDMDGGEEADLWEPGGNCVTLFEVNGSSDAQWEIVFEKLR